MIWIKAEIYRSLTNIRILKEIINSKNKRKIYRFLDYKIKSLWQELPRGIYVEPIAFCNLNCPLCNQHPSLFPRYKERLNMDTYKKIIDAIRPYTYRVMLEYACEPLTHPDIFEMIKHANRCGLLTAMETNATLMNKEKTEALLESKLDTIVIGFDGFSQESYSKYRVGGDFQKTLRNIETLVREKKRRKLKTPCIKLQFLVTSFNEEEEPKAREYFKSIGVDKYTPRPINLNIHRRTDKLSFDDLKSFLPKDLRKSYYMIEDKKIKLRPNPQRPAKCHISDCPVITCRGDILFCCHDCFDSFHLGNVFKKDFIKIWNHPDYKNIRILARQRRHKLCQDCAK